MSARPTDRTDLTGSLGLRPVKRDRAFGRCLPLQGPLALSLFGSALFGPPGFSRLGGPLAGPPLPWPWLSRGQAVLNQSNLLRVLRALFGLAVLGRAGPVGPLPRALARPALHQKTEYTSGGFGHSAFHS